MTSYVDSAHVIGDGKLRVDYRRTLPGTMTTLHSDFIDSYPLGSWQNLRFNRFDQVSYSDFLKTMVFNNTEVVRKIAYVAYRDLMSTEPSKYTLEWIMYKLRILDPTFDPPTINLNCAWQRDLLRDICTTSVPHVILTCRNHDRLHKLATVMKSR